jgi:hypothetical protein
MMEVSRSLAKQFFCKLCFDKEVESDKGLLSQVHGMSVTSSSGNFISHALMVHGKDLKPPASAGSLKISSWLDNPSSETPAQT